MEADSDHDNDINFGGDRESIASSTISLVGGITDYPIENGRRYHAYQAGKYMMPNDQPELDRMELEHHNQRLMTDGKLYAAPLDNPQEVLDIGTGSGLWAIDMADQHPGASIIGTDLSPIQPKWVPPNCRFEVDDFEQEWFVLTHKQEVLCRGNQLTSFIGHSAHHASTSSTPASSWVPYATMPRSTSKPTTRSSPAATSRSRKCRPALSATTAQ